jgi:hypothetical protein
MIVAVNSITGGGVVPHAFHYRPSLSPHSAEPGASSGNGDTTHIQISRDHAAATGHRTAMWSRNEARGGEFT